MHVREEQRRRLHELLRERLGEEVAALVLEVTVPGNVDLATRGDVQELRAELLLHVTEVRAHLGELSRRLDEIDARLGGRLDDIDARLGGRLGEIDARQGGRLDRVDGRLDAVGARVDAVGDRIDRLEHLLLWRAVPLMLAGTGTFVALATWVALALG